jgi:hypothetical protein
MLTNQATGIQTLYRVCPKTPKPVIARRFLPKQSHHKTAEIASSHKTLLAMTVAVEFADRHYITLHKSEIVNPCSEIKILMIIEFPDLSLKIQQKITEAD